MKSGSLSFYDHVRIRSNQARGPSAAGHGNGGGIFVTTSWFDEIVGAGSGAAWLFESDGTIYVEEGSDVRVENNWASRWGGGLFGGVTPGVYNLQLVPFAHSYVDGYASLMGATFSSNVCETVCQSSSWLPAQVAFVSWRGILEQLLIDNTTFEGRPNEAGLYLLESDMDSFSNCSFVGLGINVVEESLE